MREKNARRAPNSFQRMVEEDINDVFLNPDEFGSYHNIDGRDVLVVVDNDALRVAMDKTDVAGTGAKILYFVKADALAKEPHEGDPQLFDGRACVIEAVYEDEGMYEVRLIQHRAGGAY